MNERAAGGDYAARITLSSATSTGILGLAGGQSHRHSHHGSGRLWCVSGDRRHDDLGTLRDGRLLLNLVGVNILGILIWGPLFAYCFLRLTGNLGPKPA